MSDVLIVKSKIKGYIKGQGCNSASELIDGNEINKRITELLDKAVARAKANNRKTVMEKDL